MFLALWLRIRDAYISDQLEGFSRATKLEIVDCLADLVSEPNACSLYFGRIGDHICLLVVDL